MSTLADLLKEDDGTQVLVAAFPLEDTSKSLADVFPPSWINQEKQTIVPLLVAPKEIVKDLCNYMFDKGNEFLKEHYGTELKFSVTKSSEED